MPSIYRPKVPAESDADPRIDGYVKGDAQPPETANPDRQSVWAGRRKAQPATDLLPATRRWMESLPSDSRPNALVAQFPRIANLIAVNWNNPRDCGAFLYTLLHDQRGGRRGFPQDVSQDILNLRLYYARLHPIADWTANDGHSHFWTPPTPKR